MLKAIFEIISFMLLWCNNGCFTRHCWRRISCAMCIDIYLYKYFCTKLERNMYTEHIYSSEARLIFYIFPLQLTRFHIQNRISIFSYSNSSYLCTWSKSSIAYMHLRCKSITKTKKISISFNIYAGSNGNCMYLKFYLIQ